MEVRQKVRIFSENGAVIRAEDIDSEKGKLISFLAIREGAVPIDNVTKFAWDDEDYEEALMYVPSADTPEETTAQQRIADLEEALALLLSGVTE